MTHASIQPNYRVHLQIKNVVDHAVTFFRYNMISLDAKTFKINFGLVLKCYAKKIGEEIGPNAH